MAVKLFLACLAVACGMAAASCGRKVGSCNVMSCSSDHGKNHCDKGYVHNDCMCDPGFCADEDGELCLADTGGTCSVFSCSSSHGNTVCVHGYCLCTSINKRSKDGTCHHKGYDAANATLIQDLDQDQVELPSIHLAAPPPDVPVFFASALISGAMTAAGIHVYRKVTAPRVLTGYEPMVDSQ